jgi:spermidine synthase
VSHPVVIERLATERGELVLRHVASDGHYEIISNGVFLMDTRGGSSERLLVAAALDGIRLPARVLIGGLGVGFSLLEALRHPLVRHVTVVELEPAVVDWHATYLAPVSHGALDDPRVTVICADFLDWLRHGSEQFDAICLDIDNGPDWTVTGANATLYLDDGLMALQQRLAPGGTCSVWSAAASPSFHARLDRYFTNVRVLTVDVPRGEPDHIYVARSRPRGESIWR